MRLLSSTHSRRQRTGCVRRRELAGMPTALRAAAMYSGWWNSAVSNGDCRRWHWWCFKGKYSCSCLQTQWGHWGEGRFRQANKSPFFSVITSGNCRGCSLSKNHLLPFFYSHKQQMGSWMGSAKSNLSISCFLNMKNVLHFSKRKKKTDKEKLLWNQKLKTPKPSLWSELGVTWINTSIDFKIWYFSSEGMNDTKGVCVSESYLHYLNLDSPFFLYSNHFLCIIFIFTLALLS